MYVMSYHIHGNITKSYGITFLNQTNYNYNHASPSPTTALLKNPGISVLDKMKGTNFICFRCIQKKSTNTINTMYFRILHVNMNPHIYEHQLVSVSGSLVSLHAGLHFKNCCIAVVILIYGTQYELNLYSFEPLYFT